MTSEFRAKLEAAIADFRAWSGKQLFDRLRIVQYCGTEMIGAHDSDLSEIENHIIGCLSEGFRLAWAKHNDSLYLCVWEGLDAAPAWSFVFAETDLDEP